MARHNYCSNCGEPYYRRNLTELWLLRNPGHRKGWLKDVQKICLKCMSVSRAHRTLDVAGVEFSKSPIRKLGAA